MNQKQSPANIIQRPARLDKSEKHLHGHWLVLARVGWIVVTATLVILNLIALPDTYVANFTYHPTDAARPSPPGTLSHTL